MRTAEVPTPPASTNTTPPGQLGQVSVIPTPLSPDASPFPNETTDGLAEGVLSSHQTAGDEGQGVPPQKSVLLSPLNKASPASATCQLCATLQTAQWCVGLGRNNACPRASFKPRGHKEIQPPSGSPHGCGHKEIQPPSGSPHGWRVSPGALESLDARAANTSAGTTWEGVAQMVDYPPPARAQRVSGQLFKDIPKSF